MNYLVTHQGGLAEDFASLDEVSDGDVEVRVPAAPVGDLSEGMSYQNVLPGQNNYFMTISIPIKSQRPIL